MKVALWLRVERNNKYVRGKKRAREEIERYVLAQYEMKKPRKDSWDYALSIPYETDEELDELILQLQGPVGKLILDSWKLPEHFSDVVTKCYDFKRNHEGQADYTDLIQVSLLQGGYAELKNGDSQGSIEAFQKLNIDPEINVVEIEENQQVIEETKQQLLH